MKHVCVRLQRKSGCVYGNPSEFQETRSFVNPGDCSGTLAILAEALACRGTSVPGGRSRV